MDLGFYWMDFIEIWFENTINLIMKVFQAWNVFLLLELSYGTKRGVQPILLVSIVEKLAFNDAYHIYY